MRTTARRFRPIFHRHPSPPPRPAAAYDPEPVALEAAPAAPPPRLKAWLRLGAHSVLAVAWVTLPQFVGSRLRVESEPVVVEVDRPCPCGRVAHAPGRSLRESLAPKDDAALDGPEAPAAPPALAPRPPVASGFCASPIDPARAR
jgi:hypothetical protein